MSFLGRLAECEVLTAEAILPKRLIEGGTTAPFKQVKFSGAMRNASYTFRDQRDIDLSDATEHPDNTPVNFTNNLLATEVFFLSQPNANKIMGLENAKDFEAGFQFVMHNTDFTNALKLECPSNNTFRASATVLNNGNQTTATLAAGATAMVTKTGDTQWTLRVLQSL